jgi:glycosyltransferase involved in cell wall biosynthesis
VLFMLINMNIGGTEKALLNMISEMPRDKFDITILMLEHYGGFLESIPKDIKVEYIEEYNQIKEMINMPIHTTAFNFFKKGSLIKSLILFTIFLISLITKEKIVYYRYVLKKIPVNTKVYDIAVAYAGPMDFISFFIIEKIKANKKYQWIHFDVEKIGFNINFANKLYHKFDKIFVVSEEGRVKLVNILPDLKDKIDSFTNIVSEELVIKMAQSGDGFKDNFSGVRILTVGRLSEEKGQELAIKVTSRLKREGFTVRWYCIGEGKAREKYKELIKYYGLEEDFLLLGSKMNPYTYMKQCDLYVQSSRHEGFCITLAEAKCFENPIICTNFTGASHQIENLVNGLIVNYNEQQMFEAIKWLLTDKDLKTTIKQKLGTSKPKLKKNLQLYNAFELP